MEIPAGSVVITPVEMYTELRDVHDEIKRLATLIDPALAEVRADITENKNRVEAHDLRLRAVELRVWFAAGVAAGAGGLGGWVASMLTGG